MKLERLEAVQRLPIALNDAWVFFSNPANLQRITPPSLGFEVTTPLLERMYARMLVGYRVRPLFGIPMRWVTEITHVDEPRYFVDEQRFGPYAFWHHEHHFAEIPGGVEMRDIVHYALPGGFVGRLGLPLVKKQLATIFDYRREVLLREFGAMEASARNAAMPLSVQTRKSA